MELDFSLLSLRFSPAAVGLSHNSLSLARDFCSCLGVWLLDWALVADVILLGFVLGVCCDPGPCCCRFVVSACGFSGWFCFVLSIMVPRLLRVFRHFVPRLLVVGSWVFHFVVRIDVWISYRFWDGIFCGLGFVICIGRWSVCSLVDRCSSSSRVGSRVVDVWISVGLDVVMFLLWPLPHAMPMSLWPLSA